MSVRRRRPSCRVLLTLALAILGSLLSATPGFAAAGTPRSGANCQSSDGKISGRGSTLQTWAQIDLISAYESDVCGYPAATTNPIYPGAVSGQAADPTDPGNPLSPQSPLGDWMVAYNYPTALASGGVGSAAGEVAASCRTDAFGASDLPYTSADWSRLGAGPAAEAQNASSQPWTACEPPVNELGGVTYDGIAADGAVVTFTVSADESMITSYSVNDIPAGACEMSAGGDPGGGWPGAPIADGTFVYQLGSPTPAVIFEGGFSGGQTASGSFRVTNSDEDGPPTCDSGIVSWTATAAPSSGGTPLTPPFTPTAQSYPTADTGGAPMTLPIGITALGLAVNFTNGDGTTESGCPASGTVLDLSTSDVAGLFGGTVTNWSRLIDTGTNLSMCNLPVVRVVRGDPDGSTQALFDYLNDANPAPADSTCQAGVTFATMQAAIGSTGTNTGSTWPQGSGCSPIVASAGSDYGIVLALETTPGAIGYADYADLEEDAGSQAALSIEDVQNASGNAAPPDLGDPPSNESNCSTSNLSLPRTGSNPSIGLAGQWALNATPGDDDASWAHQGSTAYPICALMFDIVYSDLDGNGEQASTTTVGPQTLPESTIAVASTAGFPGSGKLTVSLGGGSPSSEIVSCTGSTSASFTNCSGGNGSVPAGTSVLQYGVDPVGYLSSDQRRTLYTYFSYVLSDPAQATLAGAGYAPLTESWITTVRAAFQKNF